MSALGDELEKRFTSDYGSIENVGAHVGRAVDAKMAQTNDASTWQDALRSVKNNFVGGLENVLGGALNFIGAQIAPDAEFASSDPMSSHLANGGWGLWNDPSQKAPSWGSEALLGAGQGLMQDAQERALQDGNLYYQGGLTDRLTNPDYWTDRRGALADFSNVLGSAAPFLAATFLTRGANLPFMGDLLGGLGRGAAALAERGGVQGLLGNAAELGVNALNAGARYAAFSAPVTAMSNAGSIYSDLLDQGYSPNEIAAQMRAMAWEEFPQDIATGIMDGVLLDGGVGRLLKGGGLLSRAGKGLASVGLGGAGEYYDELNQQIIQDKYTNKPYGTWLNPTDEEAAAAAAAALGGGLFGLGGIARNAARNPSALTPAAEESGGVVTPGSAADPVANGLIASQIAATNAAVEGAQRQALAQALAGLQARPADTNLDIPEMQEPSAKASGGAGGSGATGQAVAVQGAASGAASDATNAKERLWNAILPYAKKYNVDPRLVLAQLSHESANFDSDLARSANNYGGLTTTENTGMPQPDGNMQYARFSSPEDFVDHYFKWWGDTIKDSGSDVDAFTSKLKNEGYFGADLGSYTQAVKRHMSSLEKEGYTAAAEAKPVSGGSGAAGTSENAGGVGYIASGSDAWNGFDGRYVGASSAFSQSNYDNMGKVHPETIAGVNALASEYFKRTGQKLLLNSLAGGDHPSNASEWGHAAGWKADIDNTGVDTKVFLDICEKLGIGAALEKDTHFDLSFGKGNAYMSTDQGTSDRTGTRWYEAYHSGKAAGKQDATVNADAAQGISAAQIAKMLNEGDGKQQASGVPKQFFGAFYNDVGSATTNQQLIMALDGMTNAKGEFMNTRENREQLARQFPNEVQAYALQLMREGAKPQEAASEVPPIARRIYPRPAATPHITGNIPQAGQTAALQRAARPDDGAVTSSHVTPPAAMTLEGDDASQAGRNAPQAGTQEARPSPAEETRAPQTQEVHTGNAAPAIEQAPAHIDNAAPAIEQPPIAASGTPSLERSGQQSGALNTEGAKLTPEHAAFARPVGSRQGEGAEPQESEKGRPRSMQAMAADAQQATTPLVQPADRWQVPSYGVPQAANEGVQSQDAGAPLPTVNPTVLTALAAEARSRDGRRRQGRAILDTAKAYGVDLPAPLRRVLQAGEAKKAIREAQKMLRAAGVSDAVPTANAERAAGKPVRPAPETAARTEGRTEAPTNQQATHHAEEPTGARVERHTQGTGARTEGDTRETGHPALKTDAQPAEGRAKQTDGGRPAQEAEAPTGKQAQPHAEESTGEPAGTPADTQTERHTDKQTEERTEHRTEEPRGAKFSADLSGENAAEGGNTRGVQETRAEAHTESTDMSHRDNIKGLVLFDGSATPSADTTNGTLIQDGNDNGGVASQSAFRKSTSPIKNSLSQNAEGRKNESIPKKKKDDELGEYSTTLKDILRKNPELADSLSDAQYQQVLVHMKNNNGTVRDGVYTFPTNRDKKNFSATVFAILHAINRNGKASLRGDAAKLHKMIMEAAPVLNAALTKQQKNIAEVGDRMGTPVVWLDGAKELNGFHADGITFLNRKAGMRLPKVFWHESFHYMRAHNPALYDAIVAHVQEVERITPEQIDGYRKKFGRYDLADEDIIEEMLADKMQDASERAGFFKAMAIENRSLAARAAAWIRRMIDRFVEHFRGTDDKLSERQTAAMARAFSAVMRDMKGADGKPLFRVRGTYVRTAQGAELPALRLQGRASENKIKFSVNFEENQRVNRSFLDRIAERFGRQLGLKADRIITEERQTNRERNMTLLDYLFSSPSRVAEKYQLFRAFFNIADRAYNLLTERRTYFNKKLDAAMRLAKKKEDYEDLRAVLLAGDAEQKEYTKAELLADGVKENVADAYLGVRETLKELYNMANEAHRRPSVHTRNGLTQAQVDELEANKFVRILRKDAAEAGRFSVSYREYANRENTFADVTPEALRGMQADEAMQILEATKNAAGTYTVKVREGRPALHELTGYIPHFFHEYMVRVTDASGKILRTIGSGRTEREAVTFAKAWQKENALADGEVLRIAPKTFDWTQAGLDERQYAPIMGDMDYYAMVNKLAENTGQTVKEAEEMLSGAVRLKTRHRFFGNAQHRKGVNGFEKEDLNWILRHYANSACRYYAMETEGKPKLINLYERVFGAFDKDPSTTLGRYTKQYINDLNGNLADLEKAINETLDRCPLYRKFFVARYGERAALAVAGKLSGTIASLCLGFGNVSIALLNFTQAINGTAYIGEAKAYWQIFHEGARRRFTAEEQRVLNETNVENDVGMDSGAGYDKARYSVGSLWGKVTRAGMFFFKESEGIVRRGTVLTAYKTARKRGMSHDQAILFAKEVNRKSNFEYAVTDAPNIFRRGSVFAQLALQFKKYPIKQMEVVWDMLPRRHDTKIKTKQKILFWVPYFLTSGLLGIPAFGLPDDWFDDKFSLSLKKYLMEWAGNDRAKRMAAEIALYGMPSLLGADVSSRVGLGDIIPTQGRDIAGPAVSKLLSFGRDAFNGDGASALRDVSPGLYNIYAAFGAGESSGKRGRTNNRYLTAQDRLLRAMGFRSVKESTASDVSRIETMEKKDAAAEKQQAVDAYIEKPTSENKAKLKELGVKDKTVETERKKKGQTRLQRTRDTLSKKDQKAKKDQALFDFADEK